MTYTLWSRGRLLGETDLAFAYREGAFRCGWFIPNALGERLMPMATGVSPALGALAFLGSDPTVRADLQSAIDQEEALALELRGPKGQVIETTDIGIRDMHYIMSLAVRDEPGDVALETLFDAAELEDLELGRLDLSPDQLPEHPQYQIQVILVDPADVP